MLPFIVLIILIVFFLAILQYTFGSMEGMLVNISLLAIIGFLASQDFKKRKMQHYYVAGIVVTAIMLIFSETEMIKTLLGLFQSVLVTEVFFSMIAIVFFAHLFKVVVDGYYSLKKKMKKKHT